MRWRAPMQIYPDPSASGAVFLPNLSGVTDDNGQHGVQNVQCIIQRQRFHARTKATRTAILFCGDIPAILNTEVIPA
nr:Uncharacterised protein [Klebsiella pneumoniae]